MQNENHLPLAPPKKHKGIAIAGLVLLAAGLCMLRLLLLPPSKNRFLSQLDDFLFLSPVLIVLGVAMLLAGLVSVKVGKRLQTAWRVIIWSLAILILCPWWWLEILTTLSGGRLHSEGVGISGFLMMIFLGLPILALAIFTEVRLCRNRDKEK